MFASTLNFFQLPLLLLSGVSLPLAPVWIQTGAALNPFSYAADAARPLRRRPRRARPPSSGFGVMAVLALLAQWWATRSFRRATA